MAPLSYTAAVPAAKIDVIVAIVQREGRFLVGKRSPNRPKAPNYWCPVSGRIEPGESQAEAVEREVREETGLHVRAERKVAECATDDGTALLHWWLTELLDDAPARLANDEHTELRWVTPDELEALQPTFREDVALLLSYRIARRT